VTTRGEANDFAVFAFRLALGWQPHTAQTVSDLISNLGGVDEEMKLEVWDLVEKWAQTAAEEDKALVREKIRVTTMTRGAVLRRGGKETTGADERARLAYRSLEPTDPVLRHEWLFRQAWVDESADELAEEDFNFEKREARIAELREQAVREVLGFGGMQAILRLAENGQASNNVGWALAAIATDKSKLIGTIVDLAKGGAIVTARGGLISGIVWNVAQSAPEVLSAAIAKLSSDEAVNVLLLAPFNQQTWAMVDALGANEAKRYWAEVRPFWNPEKAEFLTAINRLMQARRPRAALNLAQLELKNLPPRLLFDLIAAVATIPDEPAGTYMLDRYHLKEAFKLLNASGEFKTDELAGLEFQFIDIFDDDDARLVNLERWIATQPELFVQAVAFAFKRSDDQDDPVELRATSDEQRSARASSAYKLLDKLAVVPGSEDGTINVEQLKRWVEEVREGCRRLARQDIGDQSIGKLLSHAAPDEDGVWPCLPVRDVLEEVTNEHIGLGVEVALHNSRGVHWRGEGGDAERALAAKYGNWAASMEYTHPRVAAILRNLEQSYLRQADWEDSDARIARRMRY
jgi:hypothetical protein